MRATSRVPSRILLAALTAASMSGCLAAAGAAGAAGAIAYTERGADTRLEASVFDVARVTESVFSEMGISITERTNAEDQSRSELTGTRGEMEVVVEANRGEDGLTRVHVTAREGLVEYDRDFAEEVLRRIVEET